VALSRSRAVAAALAVALALGAASTVLVASENDAVISARTLTFVSGAVFISRDSGAVTIAHETDVLAVGDTVRTGPGAAAEITSVDGSSVRLDADAEFVVASLRCSNGGAPQTLGRAWQVITKLFTGGSRYEVRTPSASASVRG
jgi:hypothetical protein